MESKFKRVFNILKRVGKITGIALFLLVIVSMILAAIFEDRIGAAAIKALNNNLKNDMEVEEISLSFITSFPNTAINLSNVIIPDAFGDTLLKAETLALNFKTTSLMGKAIKVKQIELSGGMMRVVSDERGRVNYEIMETTAETTVDTTTTETNIGLSIEEASLNDINLFYEDQKINQSLSLDIDRVFLTGNFSAEKFDLVSYAEVKSNYFAIDSLKYLDGVDLSYDATIGIDLKKGKYQFDNVELVMESNTFSLTGNIEEKRKNESSVDLELKGTDCNISSVIKILPEQWVNSIRDFNSKGDFYFNAKAKGIYGNGNVPELSAAFGLKDGRITSPRLKEDFKDVSFTATYESGRLGKKDAFKMTDFSAELMDEPLTIKLKVENMEDPYVDFLFNGKVKMAGVYKLLDNERITKGGGKVNFEAISVEGKYEDMLDASRVSRVSTSGIVTFEEAMLAIDRKPIELEKGNFSFIDNDLLVRDLTLIGLNSDFLLNGNFNNVIPVLFADSSNTQQSELLFNAELKSKNIDFDEIMALMEIEGSTEEVVDSLKEEQNERRENFTNFFKGVFELEVDAFQYRKVDLKNLAGALVMNNNEMILRDVAVDAMGGKLKLTSNIHFERAPYIEVFLDGEGIDVREFFEQSEDFGQDYIVAENLKGTLDAKISTAIYFDEQANLIEDKLYVIADLNIKNGELIRYKMLEDFSSYVKIDDLRHIRFTDIRNQLKIENRALIIPAMFIQSNAMNLTLAGKHTFDNDMDYKMKVNAGQVVWNKYLRGNPRGTKPVKAKKKGFLNLYFKVYGNVDDPKYETNKKEVKGALAAALERELVAVKNTIKSKFDTPVLNEPLEWTDEDGDGGDEGFEF